MADTIRRVEVIPVRVPRETPYLGQLEHGVVVSDEGYFVRPGNRSVYNISDQSTLVRIESESGAVGWGECVSFVVPQASSQIIRNVIGPYLVGRDPQDPVVLYHDLYDLMRVRGYFGGYYHDAVAAVDIALWDLAAQLASVPLCKLLGGQRHETIPAYVSGLPMPTLEQRIELALTWQKKGFNAFKFASAVSHEGTAQEMHRLREALGPSAAILCDMHWKHTAPEAIRLIHDMQRSNLAVAEAPCHPEDIEGQVLVARAVQTPVGLGEELRTVFEYLPRYERRCMGVIQPEMGRTGVTSFMEICALARAFHVSVMPHASIGIGIFQAASLHASAVLPHLDMHEYQHSIFDKNLRYVVGTMSCSEGPVPFARGVWAGSGSIGLHTRRMQNGIAMSGRTASNRIAVDSPAGHCCVTNTTAFPEALRDRIAQCGVIAVLVVDDVRHTVPIAKALIAGGVDVIELTLRTNAAIEAVAILRQETPEILVGVGTVLTPGQVCDVVAAGAAFGVAPGTNRRVIEQAHAIGLPFAPGIATPSDLETALELDCRVMKFFPAEPSGGAKYLKSLTAPYEHLGLEFIPLGGLTLDNMETYLNMPSVLAVGGSWIARVTSSAGRTGEPSHAPRDRPAR